jgi:hypothetical protein
MRFGRPSNTPDLSVQLQEVVNSEVVHRRIRARLEVTPNLAPLLAREREIDTHLPREVLTRLLFAVCIYSQLAS